jgi:hypothetical protein
MGWVVKVVQMLTGLIMIGPPMLDIVSVQNNYGMKITSYYKHLNIAFQNPTKILEKSCSSSLYITLWFFFLKKRNIEFYTCLIPRPLLLQSWLKSHRNLIWLWCKKCIKWISNYLDKIVNWFCRFFMP